MLEHDISEKGSPYSVSVPVVPSGPSGSVANVRNWAWPSPKLCPPSCAAFPAPSIWDRCQLASKYEVDATKEPFGELKVLHRPPATPVQPHPKSVVTIKMRL